MPQQKQLVNLREVEGGFFDHLLGIKRVEATVFGQESGEMVTRQAPFENEAVRRAASMLDYGYEEEDDADTDSYSHDECHVCDEMYDHGRRTREKEVGDILRATLRAENVQEQRASWMRLPLRLRRLITYIGMRRERRIREKVKEREVRALYSGHDQGVHHVLDALDILAQEGVIAAKSTARIRRHLFLEVMGKHPSLEASVAEKQ